AAQTALRGGRSTVAPAPGGSSGIPGRKADPAQTLEVKKLVDERVKLLEQGADHYALLGVRAEASADEIRKTYFALARQLHPDRLAALGVEDQGHVAHKVFAQLNTAFAVLSDPKRRADYTQQLSKGGAVAAAAEQQRADDMAMRILQAEEAFRRGELALKRNDLATAVAELGRAIELNPDEAEFHAAHAWATFCAAEDKAAVGRATRAALEKAIQRSPKAIAPRFYLGRVERMLGRDQVALGHFRDVLLDKPNHYEAASEVRVIEARLAAGSTDKGGGLFGRKR
ncbi:MAG: J domain-containing protein, partial [Myxococcota bacterium]|nr:J domain-containing protein [Myxococcota bacterium]